MIFSSKCTIIKRLREVTVLEPAVVHCIICLLVGLLLVAYINVNR